MLLNCDLGESFGHWKIEADEKVMPYIDMANIACGMHAGDPCVMVNSVALARKHQVRIGAHPSYPDLQGFGRRSMAMSAAEIEAFVLYQLGALSGICQSQDVELRYVKPHGALYNDMMKNDDILNALFTALKKFNSTLPLVMLATPNNNVFREKAAVYGIKVLFEAFADRAYDKHGYLIPRTQPNAVLHDAVTITEQVKQLTETGSITSSCGELIRLEADTLCVHGDNQEAVNMVKQLKHMLT